MSAEALTTFRIEGEIFNRSSVQSSIRREPGRSTDKRRAKPGERGIAEVMVHLYQRHNVPLTEGRLLDWHRRLVRGREDLVPIGAYRTGDDPIQVISGPSYAPKVHFEAPPSRRVAKEMSRFLAWYRRTCASGSSPLPVLTRAGIAHLYFESIHPFEDGNGRIGRARSEKILLESKGQPGFVALAGAILIRRKEYYEQLEAAKKSYEVTRWLLWFAGIPLEAQLRTEARMEFLLDKTRLLDRLRGPLNSRQSKALLRMLEEGPEGFTAGLSAANCAALTGASPATTTHDLSELVTLGALRREGERRNARYFLTIPLRPVERIPFD